MVHKQLYLFLLNVFEKTIFYILQLYLYPSHLNFKCDKNIITYDLLGLFGGNVNFLLK